MRVQKPLRPRSLVLWGPIWASLLFLGASVALLYWYQNSSQELQPDCDPTGSTERTRTVVGVDPSTVLEPPPLPRSSQPTDELAGSSGREVVEDARTDLESFTPSRAQLSAFRRVRLRASSIGMDLPGYVRGPKEMWEQLEEVDRTYGPEVAAAKAARNQRLHALAYAKSKAGIRERVGDAGALQKVSRQGNQPSSSAFVASSEGTFRVDVSPGEDGEMDKLDAGMRELSVHYVEAASFVLREHGAIK